jgi:hypothetical protein
MGLTVPSLLTVVTELSVSHSSWVQHDVRKKDAQILVRKQEVRKEIVTPPIIQRFHTDTRIVIKLKKILRRIDGLLSFDRARTH